MNKETPREAVKNVLERMSEGALWQPKGLGLSYVKSGAQAGHTYFTREHSN